MDINALLWLAIPLLIMVMYVVLVKVRPVVLKRSRKSNYAVAIVVIALVIV
jgi:hypothetical protein